MRLRQHRQAPIYQNFLKFFNDPSNKKKYMFNTNLERELLFYFDKISDEDKKEIIEFTKIKARKPL